MGGGEGVGVSRRGYGPVWMGKVMEVGMDMEGAVERGHRRGQERRRGYGQLQLGEGVGKGLGMCCWTRAWQFER